MILARKKKSAALDILEGGLKDTHIVQKSRPLVSLWESGLSLAEFKLLDIYLSRINSQDTDAREVVFSKGDVEQALGVKRVRQEVLEDRLKHLMGTVVKIKDDRKHDGFVMLTLFSMAIAQKDESDQWIIKLRCSEEAKEYFFNVEHLGYLRYKLGVVMRLNSVYSYILFQYLELNRRRKVWEISVDDLREILQCNAETYQQFFRFNGLILKKCHEELNQKTECKFDYEPVKKGRKVVAVRFKLHKIAPEDALGTFEGNCSEISGDNVKAITESAESILDRDELFSEACDNIFSQAEMSSIVSLIELLPENKLPKVDSTDDITIRRYHYLKLRYNLFKVIKENIKIEKPYHYFLKLIKNDIDPE